MDKEIAKTVKNCGTFTFTLTFFNFYLKHTFHFGQSFDVLELGYMWSQLLLPFLVSEGIGFGGCFQRMTQQGCRTHIFREKEKKRKKQLSLIDRQSHILQMKCLPPRVHLQSQSSVVRNKWLWIWISCAHGQQSEDHFQEKSTSNLRDLVMGDYVKQT